MKSTPPEWMSELVTVDEETGCWEWRHVTCDGYGYAAKALGGDTRSAHRFVYQREVGPIPVGLTIDHLCMNRACVNPRHLEAVPQSENTRRAGKAAGTFKCSRGHALWNPMRLGIYLPDGTFVRVCRGCVYELWTRWDLHDEAVALYLAGKLEDVNFKNRLKVG